MNDAKKDYHPYVQGGDRTPCDRCGKALPGAYIRWSDKKVLCGLCYIKLPD
jgi:formylmethanofuran dehydrogenase subunit E